MSIVTAAQAIRAALEQARADWNAVPGNYALEIEYDNRNTVDRANLQSPYLTVDIVWQDGQQMDLGLNPLVQDLGHIVLAAGVKEGAGSLDLLTLLTFIRPYLQLRDDLGPARTQAAGLQKEVYHEGFYYQPMLVPFWLVEASGVAPTPAPTSAPTPAPTSAPTPAPTPAPAPVTWDTALHTSGITFANGNLTAIEGVAEDNGNVVSTTSCSTGKVLLGFTVDHFNTVTNAYICPSLANLTFDATSTAQYAGDANSIGAYDDGSIYVFGVLASSTGIPYTQGSCALWAIDFDAGKVWWGVGGTFNGDPLTGTAPTGTFAPNTPLKALLTMYGSPLDAAQASGLFGASPFPFDVSAFTAAGFVGWNGAVLS